MSIHRALCRVVEIDDTHAHLEIVTYTDEGETYPLPLSDVPQALKEFLKPDYRFHGRVNYSDDRIVDLEDFEWDGRTVEEQQEAIRQFEKKLG